MDPALHELARRGDPDDEVGVIVRLRNPDRVPATVRVVNTFGDIATVRVHRRDIAGLWADPATLSVKAPRLYTPDVEPPLVDTAAESEPHVDHTRLDLEETGRGVVVGVVDWGFDFAHPDFRQPDGRTRMLALWDQRSADPASPGPAGPSSTGRLFTAAHIDAALAQPDPYQALGYHPADFDTGIGAHGTHTLSIAAGNGLAGGPPGMAPEADIVAVSLSRQPANGMVPLGSSGDLLDACAMIFDIAGDRPCVINLSLGRQAGEHTGRLLLEQVLDRLVSTVSGRAVVLSCGNYLQRRTHASWQLRAGEARTFRVAVDPADPTPNNEVDIWYPGRDRLTVEVATADGAHRAVVPLGDHGAVGVNGRDLARIYHRAYDPNNGDHQISLFLDPDPAVDGWHVTLHADDVVDGRVHAWIERDATCRRCQAHFDDSDVDAATTLGTIANSFRTITVGAYDAHRPDRPPAPFSSSGPTRDGRQKPDLVAPGVRVLGARSHPRTGEPGPAYVRMSGTSMGAPAVAGTVALMFQAAGCPLSIEETRRALLASCDPPMPGIDPRRLGSGYLQADRAVAAVRHSEPDAIPPAVVTESVTPVAGCGEPVPSTARPAVLRIGSRHPAVGDAQRQLNSVHAAELAAGRPRLPDAPLTVDCVFGARTYAAVVGFQQRAFPGRSAEHDGRIGPRTWALLDTWESPSQPPQPLKDTDPCALTNLRVAVIGGEAAESEADMMRPGGLRDLLTSGPEVTDAYGEAAPTYGEAVGPCPDVSVPLAARPALLVRGSVHPAVRSAQRRFNAIHAAELAAGRPGLTGAPLVDDCVFGPRTRDVVVAFQRLAFPGQPKEHDGRIGPKTWAALDAGLAAPPPPSPPLFVPPAPPSPALAGPRVVARPCCMLAPAFLTGASGVGGHGSNKPDIVYTGRAGFVDLGHLWDVCDVTAFAYQEIHRASGASGTKIPTAEGEATLTSTVPPTEWMEVARSIAFDDALAHEIATYANGAGSCGFKPFAAGAHNSSFSPEDLCSNFLGTVVAERAITASGAFVPAAKREVTALLASLDAQSDAETRAAFALIAGRWVDVGLLGITDSCFIKRRNFTSVPFKTGHKSDAPTPVWVVKPFAFTATYDYRHATGFRRANFGTEIARIKAAARAQYGPDFASP